MEVEVQHVVAVVVMGRGYFDHVSVTSLLMPPSGRCSTTSPWGRVRWWFKRRRAIISSVLLVLLLLPHSCSNRSVHRHSMATSRASFVVVIYANKLIMTQFRDFFYDGMKRGTIEDDILLLHWWSSEMCCDYSSIFSYATPKCSIVSPILLWWSSCSSFCGDERRTERSFGICLT